MLAGDVVKPLILLLVLLATVAACATNAAKAAGIESIENIVVIYAENRSFDNLYGSFPRSLRRNTPSATATDRCSKNCRRFGAD